MKSNHKVLLYITYIFFTGCLLLTSPAVAEEKDPPITITADEMSSTEATNSVTFIGDVDAKQGGIRIRSDEMIIFYGEQKKKKEGEKMSQKVEKIVCTGNVSITRDDWVGTSNKMVYLAQERKILLTGNAKAVQDNNMVNGDQIVYYMDEGRSEVIGGTTTTVNDEGTGEKKKKRVNMTIIQ